MPKPEGNTAARPSAPPGGAGGPSAADSFERAKRQLALACGAIGGGLAVAGSVDRTTGGVLVLAGWIGAIVSLHRLGRRGGGRA